MPLEIKRHTVPHLKGLNTLREKISKLRSSAEQPLAIWIPEGCCLPDFRGKALEIIATMSAISKGANSDLFGLQYALAGWDYENKWFYLFYQ